MKSSQNYFGRLIADGHLLIVGPRQILKVISQLELAQLIGTGVKTKFLEKEQVYDKKMAHNLQATLGKLI